MNLLCPNCQKPLTVAEQYAGQPMRCPLCAGTFTVPALPQTPPPSPPPAPAETYGVKDPVAPPPPPPELNFESAPPAPKAPSSFTGSPPSGPSPAFTDEQPNFPVTPTPEGYHRKYTIWFSPRVLQYVAPVAVFLILILTFFAWTGVYPGGVPSAWQNAWQAVYGGWSYDADVIKDHPPFAEGAGPGWNFLLLFYLLLFIPTLVVTVGCLALAFVSPAKLPPAIHPILPWRWGIVAALNLVLLLFLVLQLMFGFSLENSYIAAADKAVAAKAQDRKGGVSSSEEQRSDAIERGRARQDVSRTVWLDLVVLFSILAVAGAGLMFCLNRRGTRPAPRIDMLW